MGRSNEFLEAPIHIDARLAPSQDAAACDDKKIVLYQAPGAPVHLTLRWPIQRRAMRYPSITIFGWNRDFRPWAALDVLLIHAGSAYWLMHFGAGTSRNASARDVDPLVLQIVFLPARVPREHGPAVTTRWTATSHRTGDVVNIRKTPVVDGKASAQAGISADRADAKPLRRRAAFNRTT